MTPEERVAAAAEELVAAMAEQAPELYEECRLLADLDPAAAGVRVHANGDAFELVWVGRHLGSVSAHWVATGDTGPASDIGGRLRGDG